MIDLQDKTRRPTLEEIASYVRSPAFLAFCGEIQETYQCGADITYSACSMDPGWNVKFKKAGRALCTIYPRESYFTVMVVVGRKEKEAAEAALPDCCGALREIYQRTREWNGQRWLMIDLEDKDGLYRDVLRLIAIRRRGGKG